MDASRFDIRETTTKIATLKCDIDMRRAEIKKLSQQLSEEQERLQKYMTSHPDIDGFDDIKPQPIMVLGKGRVLVNTRYTITNVPRTRLPPLNAEFIQKALASYTGTFDIERIIEHIIQVRESSRTQVMGISTRKQRKRKNGGRDDVRDIVMVDSEESLHVAEIVPTAGVRMPDLV